MEAICVQARGVHREPCCNVAHPCPPRWTNGYRLGVPFVNNSRVRQKRAARRFPSPPWSSRRSRGHLLALVQGDRQRVVRFALPEAQRLQGLAMLEVPADLLRDRPVLEAQVLRRLAPFATDRRQAPELDSANGAQR